MIATQSAARIERIIEKYQSGTKIADFRVHLPVIEGMGHWFACSAAIRPGAAPDIRIYERSLTPEQAAAVTIAVGMAVDWIAETVGEVARDSGNPH